MEQQLEEIALKVCKTCNIQKPITEFHRDKYLKSGRCSRCRSCTLGEQAAKYKALISDPLVRERVRAKQRARFALYVSVPENKNRVNELQRKRKLLDPEYANRQRELTKQWLLKNKTRAYAEIKARRKSDPVFRITLVYRSYICNCLRKKGTNRSAAGRFYGLVGCSIKEFCEHLESQWEPWMSWDNYGSKIGFWSVDHIRPISSFDLRDDAQLKACFHYSNCRPLSHLENMRKGAKCIDLTG